MDEERAWAQGTYEYRAQGTAVIAVKDLFRLRDFSRSRRPPSPRDDRLVGVFGSLEEVNLHLMQQRVKRKPAKPGPGTRSLLF
jgi:hypothetical protein